MLALSPENSATTTVPSSGGNQQIRRTAKPSWNGCDTRHKAYFFACRTPLIVGVSSWAESPNVADNPFPRRRIRRPPLHSRRPCRPLPPAVRAAHRSYPARRVPSPIMALCAYAFQVISKSCRRAFTRRALNVGALEYGAAMLRTSRNHQRQHCHRSKEQREDFSLNDSHAAGRSENSRLLWATLLIVVYMPVSTAIVLSVVATAPGWIQFRGAGQIIDVEELRRYMGILAVDASGLVNFIAFGGLLLAINRFEGVRQSDIDAATAMRFFIVLRFRNAIQWLAILGTATGPLGGALWIALHLGHDGWISGAVSIALASAAIWTVLVLSVPSSGYFGLQSVAKEWTLIHTAFRRDMLVRTWGNRWMTNIWEAPVKRWWMWHMIWRWLIIALAATGEAVLLAQLTDEVKLGWDDPGALPILIALFLFNAYVGGIFLVFAGLVVEIGMTASHRGWHKTGFALKFLSLSFGPVLAITSIGFDYLPLAAMAWTVAALQMAFLFGMLNNGNLGRWFWLPVRGLVTNARSQSHQWAHVRWRTLDESLNASLKLLHRRERKRKEKEIAQWRDRITLSET